jgi:ankyrin repeat protein
MPKRYLRFAEDQYPIHVAAVHGDVDMCRLLVSHGAQLDSRNGVRETPMHIAIQHNHIQVAEFFFNHVWQRFHVIVT